MTPKILINGATRVEDVPGLAERAGNLDIAFAPDRESLATLLPGKAILLGWNFSGRDLRDCWHAADNLRWIHWCGAGVDAALFPGLRESDVTLTNARGIFDRAMAEYVLGTIIMEETYLV